MSLARRPSLAWISACLCLAAGCAPKAYVKAGLMDHPPKRVAVLPFQITYAYDLTADESIPEAHTIGRDTLRKTFYYGFTPLGYEDIKLADVDQTLSAKWGPIDGGGWQRATPQELGAAVGVDALIYGDISRLMHFATPLYTETSLTVKFRMVDARTGEELWHSRLIKSAERGGALVKKGQIVDFVKDQARSAHPEVKFLRIADVAVDQALKGLPNPPMTLGEVPARTGTGGVRLAILPLATKNTKWGKGAEALRRYLAENLQERPFEVVELQRVDAALEQLGWHEGEPVPASLDVQQLAKTLGADTVLQGTVTKWGRTYAVVESWVKAELHLDLLDGRTGEAIWSKTRKGSHQAGLLKGPTGYKSVVTAPITGMKMSNLERVANHLTRDLSADLNQSPAVLAYLHERQGP